MFFDWAIFFPTAQWGLDVSRSDDRRKDLAELADYLLTYFPQYARGAHYIQQLAGEVAVQRKPVPRLEFILAGPTAPLQRGQAQLNDPEPHNVQRLRVKFHRYYWGASKKKNKGISEYQGNFQHVKGISSMSHSRFLTKNMNFIPWNII